ncbi:MAG: hypothetical protein RIF34_06690 [Candidatus Kapaibacterium sp.]
MKILIIVFLVSCSIGNASPTNLEVISNSIDSLAKKSNTYIYNEKIKIRSNYSQLLDKLESSYKKLDSSYQITNSSQYGTLISLDSIQIEYEEANKTRTVRLVANIQTLADDNIVDYTIPFTYTDTIEIANLALIEDETFPFTKGKLIEHSSFWDDAIEPVIFVGSAAVIIYLLFTVRSS